MPDRVSLKVPRRSNTAASSVGTVINDHRVDQGLLRDEGGEEGKEGDNRTPPSTNSFGDGPRGSQPSEGIGRGRGGREGEEDERGREGRGHDVDPAFIPRVRAEYVSWRRKLHTVGGYGPVGRTTTKRASKTVAGPQPLFPCAPPKMIFSSVCAAIATIASNLLPGSGPIST